MRFLSKQLHLKGGQARLPRRCLTISHRNRTIVGGVIKKGKSAGLRGEKSRIRRNGASRTIDADASSTAAAVYRNDALFRHRARVSEVLKDRLTSMSAMMDPTTAKKRIVLTRSGENPQYVTPS